ncbi:MAG TPA: SulP family inorganic anion transporter [Paracoccaceae bacterium]|nr:SulP family inorganic anion transporter [Paracoccaceae bacterium]
MRRPAILDTLPATTRASLTADVLSGFTVAMVAIPLSLAIAIASGADPATGLITAIVAGFLISAFGGSHFQIGGPTGAFIVVVYGVIAAHGFDGLVIATLMAGLILLVAGFLRAGSLIAYIPEAVIDGFTMGIAVIIGTSQLKDFFGLTLEKVPADFLEKIQALWEARDSINPAAVILALVTMALIVLFRRAAPRLPGLIVAVALVSIAVAVTPLDTDTIGSRFGDLPKTLPWPKLPDFSLARIEELIPSALVIAFLAGVESLLSAVVADRMTTAKHRPNAELIAQGIANFGSSLFGGLPATGAIARTATNIRAGGQTPLAGIIHALTILIVMWLAAPLASFLAMPALAGLLMLTAWNMAEPHKWRAHLAKPRADLFVLLVTFGLTVLADLAVAIGVGVSLGLAVRMRRRKVPPVDWTPRDQ